MKQYLSLMNRVMQEGILKEDRTGTGTKSGAAVSRLCPTGQAPI